MSVSIVKIPVHANLSDPSTVGLQHTKNFFMHVEEGVDIGVWYCISPYQSIILLAISSADIAKASVGRCY